MSKIRLNLDINQLIDHELCFVLKVKRFDKINCCYAHLRYKPLKSIETFEKNENAYAFFFHNWLKLHKRGNYTVHKI